MCRAAGLGLAEYLPHLSSTIQQFLLIYNLLLSNGRNLSSKQLFISAHLSSLPPANKPASRDVVRFNSPTSPSQISLLSSVGSSEAVCRLAVVFAGDESVAAVTVTSSLGFYVGGRLEPSPPPAPGSVVIDSTPN